MKSLLTFIWTLLCMQATSQQVYTKQLTDYPVYEVTGIKTVNNILVAAWMEVNSSIITPDTIAALDKVVAIKVSDDQGRTWSEKQIFDDSTRSTNANPTLASDDDGVIYMVKMSIDGSPKPNVGSLDLYRSIDDGQSWSNVKVIVPASLSSWPDKPWLIAKGSGELFLVYTSVKSPNDTKFMRSLDGGNSWSTPITLSTGETIGPSISFGKNDDLLVSWATNLGPVYFTKSTDNGLTFQAPITTSNGVVPGWSVTELISSPKSNQITIVFHNTHALGPVGTISSIDGGVNWGNHIFHSGSGNLITGDIDSAGNTHILYNEMYHGVRMNTYVKSSSDSGTTFSTPFSLHPTLPPAVTNLDKYIGAYQSLICSKQSDVKHAFWIDWVNNKYHLKYSAWPRSPSFSVKSNPLKINEIKVFPNPVSRTVSIKGENILVGTSYFIVNSSGARLIGGVIQEKGKLTIDLDYLPKGFYFLLLMDKENGGYHRSKLVKQ